MAKPAEKPINEPKEHRYKILNNQRCPRAIGAIGGFFIPKAFGTSLAMTGSPAGAMKIFVLFYIACVLITWLVYGRKHNKQ